MRKRTRVKIRRLSHFIPRDGYFFGLVVCLAIGVGFGDNAILVDAGFYFLLYSGLYIFWKIILPIARN